MSECKKILYAEDEEDIRSIVQLALVDISGFELKMCENGAEVLKAIHSFTPDLFLLDVMMPEMDGIKTFLEIKKNPQFANTPVIFMTARAQRSEIDEYIQSGVSGVILKPFDPMKIGDEIKNIWNKVHG